MSAKAVFLSAILLASSSSDAASIQYSLALRNTMANQIEPTVGQRPIMRLCGGPVPANADAPDGGTAFVKITLPTDWATMSEAGSISLASTAQAIAKVSGQPTHFRIYTPDGLTSHIQGSYTAPGGGGVITGPNAKAGLPFRANTFTIKLGNSIGLTRSLVDRPDDSTLSQVRPLYVVPSDGPDQSTDTNGKIRNSVLAFQSWLHDQTGGRRLRLDTNAGAMDIGFVRLTKTDAQIKGSTSDANVNTGYAYALNRIESDLQSLGQLASTKRYVVYYGGSHQLFCGNGGPVTGPALLTAATFFNATPPAISPSCASQQIGASPTVPAYLDYVMLHELMHTLRFIAPGSPNTFPVTTVAHVFDVGTPSPQRDLMYAPRTGADPSWGTNDPLGLILDIGHNDYYQHGQGGFLDFNNSPFLETTGANRLQFSVAIRDEMLRSIEPFLGLNPSLKFLTGTTPLSVEAADPGTPITSIALPPDWLSIAEGTAFGGTVDIGQDAWPDGVANAAGITTHARVLSASGTPHIQATVSGLGGGGFFEISNTNLVSGNTVTIPLFSITAGNQ